MVQCRYCGAHMEDSHMFCSKCGNKKVIPTPPVVQQPVQQQVFSQQPTGYVAPVRSYTNQKQVNKRCCPRCGGEISYQAVAETKRRGCFSIAFWVALWILLGLCSFGLLLIPLLRGRKSKTTSYGICQNCGYKFIVK